MKFSIFIEIFKFTNWFPIVVYFIHLVGQIFPTVSDWLKTLEGGEGVLPLGKQYIAKTFLPFVSIVVSNQTALCDEFVIYFKLDKQMDKILMTSFNRLSICQLFINIGANYIQNIELNHY